MDTKVWGPPGWVFLHTLTFNYPERLDPKNPDHVERKKYTRRVFNDLRYTLPCKYCRISFADFLKQEPIEPHLGSRAALTRWFYRVHNLVNDKLRRQELAAVESRFDELKEDVDAGRLTCKQAMKKLEMFVRKTMITEADPTFEEVCKKYESFRAGCAKPKNGTDLASCRL